MALSQNDPYSGPIQTPFAAKSAEKAKHGSLQDQFGRPTTGG